MVGDEAVGRNDFYPFYVVKNRPSISGRKSSLQSWHQRHRVKLVRRLVRKSGKSSIHQKSSKERSFRFLLDLSNTLIESPWVWTLLVVSFVFILTWVMFAGFWAIISIENVEAWNGTSDTCLEGINSFAGYLLFSIETQTTIGYGGRYINEYCPEAIIGLCIQLVIGAGVGGSLVCIVFLKMVSPVKNRNSLDCFSKKAVPRLIKDAHYPVESHTAITEDGYILTMHRIPHGKDSTVASKGPVFLMHGLLCSSADWIVSGSKSLGFSLADAGYDVWMGNNRGNTYSRHHLFPNLDTKAFYDYSYNEIGKFDLTAMIDYVLNATKKDKLGYVGFSEGVTSFFVMMSYHPQYNKKISTAVAWAPVTDMFQTQNKVIKSLAKSRILEWIVEHSKWHELLPYRKVGNAFRALCRTSNKLCSWLFGLMGSSKQHMPNQAFKDKILYNFPAGMSRKQLLHYVQGARTGHFRPYVYHTEKENLQVYGKVEPDSYNLSAVTVPMTLYYGGSDGLVNNERLLNNVVKQMKNATAILVPINDFNHLDFIWNKDDDWLINETIAKLEAAPNVEGQHSNATEQRSKATFNKQFSKKTRQPSEATGQSSKATVQLQLLLDNVVPKLLTTKSFTFGSLAYLIKLLKLLQDVIIIIS